MVCCAMVSLYEAGKQYIDRKLALMEQEGIRFHYDFERAQPNRQLLCGRNMMRCCWPAAPLSPEI